MEEKTNKKNVGLDDLYSFGAITKTVKIGSHEFVLSTLSFGDAISIENGNIIDILSKSIRSIDGESFSTEEKKQVLSNMQAVYVTILIKEYEKINSEQFAIIDDVKKN